MSYNPQSFVDILEARSLDWDELARRMGEESSVLRHSFLGRSSPPHSLLKAASVELAVPVFYFFMDRPPKIRPSLPDFRSPSPAGTARSRPAMRAIELARSIQTAASDFGAHSKTASALPYAPSDPSAKRVTDQEVENFALSARNYFGISLTNQLEAKDSAEFYSICRMKIEDKGIFVLHASYNQSDGSGFCISDPKFPVIVINTLKQTRGRQLFTLAHELAHVLIRKSGISDPFENHNKTETYCNKFASYFLTPSEYISSLLKDRRFSQTPTPEDIAAAARLLKISQQATALRLEHLGYFQQGTHQRWLETVRGSGNPDFKTKGGGGGAQPPEKAKLAKYGFCFAKAFERPLQRGLISDLDLYRFSGLKPKYSKVYFDYVKDVTKNVSRAADFGDG